MPTDRIDEDRGAVPFPLTYCLTCRAPIEVFIIFENGQWTQTLDCQICHSMKGKIFARTDSMIAQGRIEVGDIKDVFSPSFLFHQPEIEVHHDLTLDFWTARAH